MRVLVLHNRYACASGEDFASASDVELLKANGAEVCYRVLDNQDIMGVSTARQVRVALNACWNVNTYAHVQRLCGDFRPHIMHVHNYWHQWSPSVFSAAHRMNVPTVLTLHNFRPLCANGLLLRNGRVCEDCVGRTPLKGLIRRCYKQSLLGSLAQVAMITLHQIRHTWTEDIDALIVPSAHCGSLYARAGFPESRLHLKYHTAPDCERPTLTAGQCASMLYIGRVSPEKGVLTLLNAWSQVTNTGNTVLRIIGDGPQRSACEVYSRGLGLKADRVQFLGHLPAAQVVDELSRARAVILPSYCYETFNFVLLEAKRSGRPAIVSDLGALAELVSEGVTGLKVAPGDSAGLGIAILRLMQDNQLADRLGSNARSRYVESFTAGCDATDLLQIYAKAAALFSSRSDIGGKTQ